MVITYFVYHHRWGYVIEEQGQLLGNIIEELRKA